MLVHVPMRRHNTSLLPLTSLLLTLCCGPTSSPSEAPPIVCCPHFGVGGSSCAGGGSRRLHDGVCPMACDCLHTTGVARDADGCEYDVFVDHFPNCEDLPPGGDAGGGRGGDVPTG